MKHLFWLLSLLVVQAYGQVSMTVQLPPTGVMQKSQLWNVLLVSASESPMYVNIELRLTDARTNQPVLTGVSKAILLNKGAKQVKLSDVMPVSYEYLSRSADRSVNGNLMAGSYLACYSVVSQKASHNPVLAEDCLPFAVEPVGPPLLNTPADQEIVETSLPQFSWLPPTPSTIFSDLNYDMLIVELRKGQSAAEAVQQNIPVFRSLHNKNAFVNYPVSAVLLDTAKRYAWTVTANNGNQFAAQTDIWTFRVKGVQGVKAPVAENAFVQLRRELDGTVVSIHGAIQFSYQNLAGDTTVTYEVVSLEDGQSVLQSGTLKLRSGENLLQVESSKHLAEQQQYLLRITNNRKEYWYLKFSWTANH